VTRPSGNAVLLATLDTKGEEAAFLRDRLHGLGVPTITIDVGILGRPRFAPDIDRHTVMNAAGVTIEEMGRLSAGDAIRRMMQGASVVTLRLYQDRRFGGILGLGGGKGSNICAAAMRGLPFGVPKMLLSTVASRRSHQYVGVSDLIVVPTVADLIGVNRITGTVLSNAAAAMAGMLKSEPYESSGRSIVAISAMGATSLGAINCSARLRTNDYEPVVFHCTGLGGQALEQLIREKQVHALLDLTTTEIVNELCGAGASAGPGRLNIAQEMALPQVVAPGGLDMLIFPGSDQVPERYRDRLRYEHSPTAILVRTTWEENHLAGKLIGERLRTSPTACVVIPRRGVSEYDKEGVVFYDPSCVSAFESGVRDTAGDKIEIIPVDAHINDLEFAEVAVRILVRQIEQGQNLRRAVKQ